MTLEEDFIVREERAKDEGIEIGLERGREEGRQEAALKLKETALKLKTMGLSEDIISEATGLTAEEISKL